jgi:hypothetical protein
VKPFNPADVKRLIEGLIFMEEDLGTQLTMLTAIGTSSSHPTTFEQCERIREELVDDVDIFS